MRAARQLPGTAWRKSWGGSRWRRARPRASRARPRVLSFSSG